MNQKENEFRMKLLATFKVEAAEHLAAMTAGLVELEKASGAVERESIVERTFREAHSLKGAARAVNLLEIEALCQRLESKFSSLKSGQLLLPPETFDELHGAVDKLSSLLRSAGLGESSATPDAGASRRVAQIAPHRAPEEAAPRSGQGDVVHQGPSAERPAASETVRIATAKLDALFLEAEELLLAKRAARRQADDLKRLAADMSGWRRKRDELRQDVRAAWDQLERQGPGNGRASTGARAPRIRQHLEWEEIFVRSLEGSVAALARTADIDSRFLAARLDALLEDMKRVLMLPFSSILDFFPKLVRDLSREQGKEIDFVMKGGEVEVDKRILEELKDPLIHLLRNCVDHGIEKGARRGANNKAPRGRVGLSVTQKDAGRVEVVVSDDGAGIDLDRVRAASVNLGLATGAQADTFDEKKTLSLIFRSGVSTSPLITEISGRGLGLAIVREKVEKLGGSVEVETRAGSGTVFRINLPVTLATFRGVLVRVREHFFVLPAARVERVGRVNGEEIKTVENRETIEFDGRAVSLTRLGDLLGFSRPQSAPGESGKRTVVILKEGEERVAFLVDEIGGEQEVLVKNPAKPFSEMRILAGVTVLEAGKVAPVLRVEDLVRAAATDRSAPAPAQATEPLAEAQKKILVAEDSITARSLLKGILESAGYAVKTAVDGPDAFAALKGAAFDLVVSDVEMPRMSGFDLTSKIRADKSLAELPVILVTGLESREDRERGMDVGADAYLVKSGFDQTNLLEVIRRLI